MHGFPEPHVCGGGPVFASFPVPFKDPWRPLQKRGLNQEICREPGGSGFDVGMEEDSGLFRVLRKESEGQIFPLLSE